MPGALLFEGMRPAAGEFIDSLAGRIRDAAESLGPQIDDNQRIDRQTDLIRVPSRLGVELPEAIEDLVAALAMLLEMFLGIAQMLRCLECDFAQPIRRKGLARGRDYRRRIAIEALRVPLRVVEQRFEYPEHDPSTLAILSIIL